MDQSIPRPTGLRGSPSESPPRRDTAGFGPILAPADEGPTRSRVGTSRWPVWTRGRIGLLLLSLMVLPWLPICGPPAGGPSARRVRGVGDAAIQAFAFAPDGAAIATIETDHRVALRAVADGAGAPLDLDHPGLACALAFAPDVRSLAVGGSGADIVLYDLGTGRTGHRLGMPIRSVKGLAFSPDGRTLAASSTHDHEVLLWDRAAGRERARLRGHDSPVLRLAFAPDGRSLASGAQSDEAIILWDLVTGRPLRRLSIPPAPVLCLAYSPDGRWLAATDDGDRRVRLWDLEGRRGNWLVGDHPPARDPLAFSTDGRMLATVGGDGIVRLWDLATGAKLRHLGEPGDRLKNVAFSPDGRLLAASGDDADIRLWLLADLLATQPGRDR